MISRWVRVLGSPRAAFAAHEPQQWGWVLPLALVLVLSLLAGGVGVLSGSIEHNLEAVQAQLEAQGTPEAQREQALKVASAMQYAGPLVISPAFSVLWAVGIAGVLTLLGLVLQPGGEPVAFRRALSMSAHASLVVCLGLAATLIGSLSGNPMPSTSLVHVASPGSVGGAIASRLDPISILYYLVLAAGMQASLGFSRGASWLLCGGLYGGASALIVLGALAGKMMSSQS
ncbi:MAG: hypothetical protein KDD82_22420 [Planctomycetes bacterium]|nr:hypothetical protein [Planctomycetota bacterium]